MATTIEVLLKTVGGPNGKNGPTPQPGPDPEDNPDPNPNPDPKIFTKMFQGIQKFVKGSLGLNFSVGALLKQSQIFTSTIGVIFQLLGAMVDVILAPFLPILIPMIRVMGRAIPIIQTWMTQHIAPRVQALVDWFSTFMGKWDGSWALIGEEAAKQWSNFTAWWSSEGKTWVAEKIKDARDYIGDKIVALWDWFKDTDTRIKGWIIQFFVGQFVRVLTQFTTMKKQLLGWFTRLIKFAFGIPRMLLKLVGFLIRTVGGTAGKIMVGLTSFLGKSLSWVVKFLFKQGTRLITNIIKGVLKLPGLIYKGALTLISMIMKGLGGVLGKLPLIGGKLEKMLGGVSSLVDSAKNPKALAEGIGKKLGGEKMLTAMKGMAKATKYIPVLGSVATLGFGAAETIKMAKEHGWKAGVAYGTKTVAATALAATGNTAASLAVDIGGTMALNKAFTGSVMGTGGNTIININGRSTQENTVVQQTSGIHGDREMTLELANE